MEAFFLIFGAGFLGSFHCAGMCGPFVAYYSAAASGTAAYSHLAYQTGRLIAYVGVGSLAGLLGRGVFFLGETLEIQRALAIAMGAGMIVMGLAHYAPRSARFGAGFQRRLHGAMARLTRGAGGVEAAGLIGLLSPLLPCGFLYGFAVAAGATGHPLTAMAVMFIFWLGTMPALLTVGLMTRVCSARFLAGMRRAVPAILIVIGILAITGKWFAFPDMTAAEPAFCHGF